MSAGSQERGQLLQSVWGGLNSTLIAALLRLREQAVLYKERWASAPRNARLSWWHKARRRVAAE